MIHFNIEMPRTIDTVIYGFETYEGRRVQEGDSGPSELFLPTTVTQDISLRVSHYYERRIDWDEAKYYIVLIQGDGIFYLSDFFKIKRYHLNLITTPIKQITYYSKMLMVDMGKKKNIEGLYREWR